MTIIKIPKTNSNEEETINIERNMVIVGANGAGKTRFGSKLEQMNNPTKRFSAQRYLQLNEVVQKENYEAAESQLRNAYKNQSPTQPQTDYQQVLVSLFAQESQRDAEYVANTRISKEWLEIPSSVKESVLEVWKSIFPYITLKLEKDRIRAASEINDFSGIEMSDGEKVGLYLISQILLADKGCILIIDEPELHLHKSLMVRLWNKLEEQRKDCIFIYITHDLDFAVTKSTNKLIWIQSYKNSQWEWKELDPNGVIPEDLYLEILGSRKSILFVEGEKGSLDVQVYQLYYENFTVIPCGSCTKVIESVKGLRQNENLHNKMVFGLIDRDFRSTEKIDSLRTENIFCSSLNEIENIFLLPDIVQMVCTYLSQNEKAGEISTEIKKIYLANKNDTLFKAVKNSILQIIDERLNKIENDVDYNKFKETIFNETDKEFSNITLPNGNDMIEILQAYPHKGLVKLVQGKISLSHDGYQKLVLSFMSSDKRETILNVLKTYLPKIND